jgi:hypothetical protein
VLFMQAVQTKCLEWMVRLPNSRVRSAGTSGGGRLMYVLMECKRQ